MSQNASIGTETIALWEELTGKSVKEFYDNNLPSAMNDVAVYAFLNGEDKLDPKLVADIRDGFAQVNAKGFIGPGIKE